MRGRGLSRVTDALWSIIEPRLPVSVPRPRGGRPRVPDRAALTGILFVLRTGIQGEMQPLERGVIRRGLVGG